eukprot:127262_1
MSTQSKHQKQTNSKHNIGNVPNELTQNERLVCKNIKRQLREFFGVSGVVAQQVGLHLNSINKGIKNRHLEQLQAEFGHGCVVMIFPSVSHFKKRKYNIPARLKHFIPKKCMITLGKSEVIYAPYNSEISQILGCCVKQTKEVHKKGYFEQITIIYEDWNQSEIYVTYNSMHYDAISLQMHLFSFFQRKKWSSKLLWKKYDDLAYLFEEYNLNEISYIMRTCLRLHPISDCLLPQQFAELVQDPMKTEQIKQIMNEIHNSYPKSIESYEMFSNRVQNILRPQKNVHDMETIYLKTMKTMKDHVGWIKHMELLDLIRRVEGRICSYVICSNRESRDGNVYEKYKTCSLCQQVFYCTRSCQKRDWVRCHRAMCGEMYYYRCKEARASAWI